MSTDLRAAAAGYLTERRARGYRLPDHDWLIASFLDRLAARGITTITVADALAFARERPQTELAWQATRLRVIKDMAAYVHNLDPDAAGVIPAGLISATVTRRIPYLYTEEQTAQLMSAAQALSPRLLAASICTLIGLVASTGMRSGEAGALDVEDLCADKQVMTVTGKHGKQRLIPLHPTTVQALTDYTKVRAARAAPTGPLLGGPKGGRLNMTKARAIFRALVQDCRWPARPGCGAPRLHDYADLRVMPTLV